MACVADLSRRRIRAKGKERLVQLNATNPPKRDSADLILSDWGTDFRSAPLKEALPV
jgi:hypothetical protein